MAKASAFHPVTRWSGSNGSTTYTYGYQVQGTVLRGGIDIDILWPDRTITNHTTREERSGDDGHYDSDACCKFYTEYIHSFIELDLHGVRLTTVELSDALNIQVRLAVKK